MLSNKTSRSLVMLVVGALVWIIYFFEREMSRYGIYSIVDYPIHEIMSLIPLILLIATLIWIVRLISSSKKSKSLKENSVVLIVLILASIFQLSYLAVSSRITSVSTFATVESINPSQGEIVVVSGKRRLTLECPMPIYELLEIDKKYGISYETKNASSNKGRVNLVQIIKESPVALDKLD